MIISLDQLLAQMAPKKAEHCVLAEYDYIWQTNGTPIVGGKRTKYLFYIIPADKIKKIKGKEYKVQHPDLVDPCQEISTVFKDDRQIIAESLSGSHKLSVVMMYVDNVPDGVWRIIPAFNYD